MPLPEQVANGMRAVGAMYVRDAHGTSVSSHPADRVPEGVECAIEDVTAAFAETAEDQ